AQARQLYLEPRQPSSGHGGCQLEGAMRDREAHHRDRQNAPAPDADAAQLGGVPHLVGRQKVDVDHGVNLASDRRASPAGTASAGPRRSSCTRSTLGPTSSLRKGAAIDTRQSRRDSSAAAIPGREQPPPESTAPPSGTAGPCQKSASARRTSSAIDTTSSPEATPGTSPTNDVASRRSRLMLE